MTKEEFFRGLKGNDKELLDKLDNLKKELSADKLYLIYMNDNDSVFGIRHSGDADDQNILQKLLSFIKGHTDKDYGGVGRRLVVLNNDLDEVAYVTKQVLAEIQYQSVLEILASDEINGNVLLTVDAGYQKGVSNALLHLLPWVRKVEYSNDPEITITEKAAKKIREILLSAKIPADIGGLRFGLVASGCSGYQYEFKPEMKAGESDEVFEKEFEENELKFKIRIFVNPASIQYLEGTVMDWGFVEDLMSEGFIIKNPNKKGSCGCGKSESF